MDRRTAGHGEARGVGQAQIDDLEFPPGGPDVDPAVTGNQSDPGVVKDMPGEGGDSVRVFHGVDDHGIAFRHRDAAGSQLESNTGGDPTPKLDHQDLGMGFEEVGHGEGQKSHIFAFIRRQILHDADGAVTIDK